MLIEIPAKVITGVVSTINNYALWPYNSGGDDLYWSGGSLPRPYQWQIVISVTEQTHSSFRTRKPYAFNGSDIAVGDYIADTNQGVTVKITSIVAKTDTDVTCIVEDVLRYNTFRDPSTLANGIFPLSSDIVVFELNEEGQPVLDPYPSGLSSTASVNMISRFSNFEESYNFILAKTAHGFSVGELIAADDVTNSFVLADTAHPYIVGTVSNIDLGPDLFMITPFQKIMDGYDSLIGSVGSVIYADPANPGGYSLTGEHPIMVKLRQETNSVVTGSLLTPNSAVAVGSAFNLNMYPLTVANTGLPSDFVATVNAYTVNTGVTAALVEEPPTVQTDTTLLSSYGVVFVQVPSAVEINGVTVNFTTTTSGTVSFGPGYGDQYDMVSDINSANVVGIVATATSTGLVVANTALGPIDFTNVGVDGAGNPFAGPGSSSGLALTTTSGNSYITLTSAGAAAINLLDTVNSPTVDFGLYSAENGVKAAALYIEQGIRQASSYYVANISARDALTAGVGDQAYVQDIGDGTWAMYIYTIDSIWVMTANQPSSETDAQSIEVYITPTSNSTGTIHTITNGRRVSFVTVTVNVAFNTDATISVGDSSQDDRLMTTDQNDLTVTDTYSTTPSYVYETGSDTAINFYFNANGATVGNATVAITYI